MSADFHLLTLAVENFPLIAAVEPDRSLIDAWVLGPFCSRDICVEPLDLRF